MKISIDARELTAFGDDLAEAGRRAPLETRAVIKRGAQNIKTQLQSEMRGSRHFGQIAPSISYDVKVRANEVEAEIGPDKGRHGGALANVAIFGTSRGGGTVPDPQGALDAEAPNVEKHLADIIEGVL